MHPFGTVRQFWRGTLCGLLARADPAVRTMLAHASFAVLWLGLLYPALHAAGLRLFEYAAVLLFLVISTGLILVTAHRQIRALAAADDGRARAHELLTAFIDFSPARISLKDTEGRLLLVNRGFEEYFGARASDVLGKTYDDVFPPELARIYRDVDTEVLTTGRTAELERTEMAPDGEHLTRIVKFPVRTVDGQIWAVGTIASDATDRLRLKRRLKQALEAAEFANRAKSQFLANMSHELRTPLNAIIGFSEMMQQGIFGRVEEPHYRDYIDAIRNSGAHLLAIIDDILDIAKIEAGKAELVQERAYLRALVDGVIHLVEPRARQGGVFVANHVPAEFPPVLLDVQRMRQVLLNLLSNAIKFTDPGGSVVVEAKLRDGPEILVRDTGVGMRPEDIPIALEPFGQVDSGSPRGQRGTGLGLSLSKSFVELHGGTLTIDSAPGRGTTVSVRLPPECIAVQAAAA